MRHPQEAVEPHQREGRRRHEHARFLAIPHQERVDRQQERGERGPAWPAQPPADPVERQHGQRADQRAEGTHGQIAPADQRRPAVQQEVIERRVLVLDERHAHAPDLAGRPTGPVRTDDLVEPQAMVREMVEAHAERQDQDPAQRMAQ